MKLNLAQHFSTTCYLARRSSANQLSRTFKHHYQYLMQYIHRNAEPFWVSHSGSLNHEWQKYPFQFPRCELSTLVITLWQSSQHQPRYEYKQMCLARFWRLKTFEFLTNKTVNLLPWHMLFQWVKYSGQTEPLSFLWLIPLLSRFQIFTAHNYHGGHNSSSWDSLQPPAILIGKKR